eukprot:3373988-Pyramimonas_sp.AAC.1
MNDVYLVFPAQGPSRIGLARKMPQKRMGRGLWARFLATLRFCSVPSDLRGEDTFRASGRSGCSGASPGQGPEGFRAGLRRERRHAPCVARWPAPHRTLSSWLA